MTISRTQIQQLRDMARADASGHYGNIDRHLDKLATELDALDAVLARDGIEYIWGSGGRTPPKPLEEPGQPETNRVVR